MKLIAILLNFLILGGSMHQATARTLTICLDRDIRSVIPYEAGDVHSTHVTGMLYDGLMRKNAAGALICAVAASYAISSDKKTYTFKLKKTFWSNGDPVTAYDFAYSWKKQIDSQNGLPLGCDFYGIKNARACFRKEKSIDEVGISVKDDLTLTVELEHPNPFFLSFVASRSYFPVNRKTDNELKLKEKERISNGPFVLKKWKIGYGIKLAKNPTYWDAEHVHLEKIDIQIVPEMTTQLDLYAKRKVDYIGSPLSLSFDPEILLNHPLKKELQEKDASTVFCLMANTKKNLLANRKFRQALSLAISRTEIVQGLLSQAAIAATGFLAGKLKVAAQPLLQDTSSESEAQRFFNEALKELNITSKELPPITLSYRSLNQAEKVMMTIQSQWKKVLGLNVKLRKSDYKVHMENLGRGNFEIGGSFWCTKFVDPSYVLSFFLEKEQWTNFSNWENAEYRQLLGLADGEAKEKKRIELIQKAEDILLREMPMIPVYFTKGLWLQNPHLKGVVVSDLGEIDFKGAYFE